MEEWDKAIAEYTEAIDLDHKLAEAALYGAVQSPVTAFLNLLEYQSPECRRRSGG